MKKLVLAAAYLVLATAQAFAAQFYYDSHGSNTAPYDTWAKASTSLATVSAAMAAGDSLAWASNSAEAVAGFTVTFPGTAANPNIILCANSAGSQPPVAADLLSTCTISTTANNNISLQGNFYMEGCGGGIIAGASTGSPSFLVGTVAGNNMTFKNCKFVMGSTGASASITFGTGGVSGAGTTINLINTTFKFAAVGQNIVARDVTLNWTNGTSSAIDATGSIPTTLFTTATIPALFNFNGIDLSQCVTGKTILGATAAPINLYAQDTALGSGCALAATQTAYPNAIYTSRVDSGATNDVYGKQSIYGTSSTETTITQASGSASNGTRAISHKIVASSTATWQAPFSDVPIAIWNTGISPTAETVTLSCTWASASLPFNDDVWLEVGYLGSSSTPQASFVNNTKATILTTHTQYSASGVSWNSSPGAAFNLTGTYTAQQAGNIYATVKSNTTTAVYCNPLATIAP